MRTAVVVTLLATLALPPAGAQEPEEGSGVLTFTSHGYPVQVKAPPGWKSVLAKPVSDRTWVHLAQFSEPRTGATVALSAQAAAYRSSNHMIEQLKEHFQKDATKAILRSEVRSGSARRPPGILFEYTYKGSSGAEHAVRAYWFYNGKRYRIYGACGEMKWRTVSAQIEDFAQSFHFTARVFTGDAKNFTDEAGNYAIYFPDEWTIELPARGPRVIVASKKLGVMALLYVEDAREELRGETDRLASRLRDQRGVTVKNLQSDGPKTHPDLGFEVVRLDYVQTEKGTSFRHRETVALHAGKLYRVVLRGTEEAFGRGIETYDRIVRSLSFLR
jgi:hypothetical protein